MQIDKCALQTALKRSIARARKRLIPLLLLMYVVSLLDRANIGYAKQSLQASTGLSETGFALGAGLFFLTYSLLEIPSNFVMRKVGAKLWMSRIMVTWGLISAATMLVTGSTSFYAARLLLGAAEAGFFPGVILYLTYWFPDCIRGKILGLFYLGVPLAFILGGPISGLLLDIHGRLGLKGWQWMFLVEGLLSVAVGIWAYFRLDDRPDDAAWLPEEEKNILLMELRIEERKRRARGPSTFLPALADSGVFHFALLYLLIQMCVYSVVFYLPTDVAALLGKSVGLEVGIVSAIPWVCALAASFWLPCIGDRFSNHRQLATVVLAVSSVASALSASSSPKIALCAFCITAAGFVAVQPLFWTFPTGYLAGSAAAGGIAMINAFGTLGGFIAPNLRAWADRRFESHGAGLYFLAVAGAISAVLMTFIGHRKPMKKAVWRAH